MVARPMPTTIVMTSPTRATFAGSTATRMGLRPPTSRGTLTDDLVGGGQQEPLLLGQDHLGQQVPAADEQTEHDDEPDVVGRRRARCDRLGCSAGLLSAPSRLGADGPPARLERRPLMRGHRAACATPRRTARRRPARSGDRVPGIVEGDLEVAHDPTGPGRHHHHPGREVHRLGDRVGDEQRGESLQAKRRSSSSFKRSRVISSSAPNGSSNRNTSGWSTSDRASDARIRMPPESCCGYLSSKPPSPTRSMASRAARSGRLGHALQLGEELDVAAHGPPRQEGGVLEDVAEVLRRSTATPRGVRLEARRRCAAASTCRSRTDRRPSRTRPARTSKADVATACGAVGEDHRDVGKAERAGVVPRSGRGRGGGGARIMTPERGKGPDPCCWTRPPLPIGRDAVCTSCVTG